MKTCTVAFATPERQWLWTVMLPDEATVAAALELARAQAPAIDVPWNADVGIFGELCDRAAVPRDGDRIEIYRPLKADPKESRRERAKARKPAPDRGLSRPPKQG
jgi:putative ubiquitin-RnfH superfamily antitoxin RatB of RatAB toxin-antitoxin module